MTLPPGQGLTNPSAKFQPTMHRVCVPVRTWKAILLMFQPRLLNNTPGATERWGAHNCIIQSIYQLLQSLLFEQVVPHAPLFTVSVRKHLRNSYEERPPVGNPFGDFSFAVCFRKNWSNDLDLSVHLQQPSLTAKRYSNIVSWSFRCPLLPTVKRQARTQPASAEVGRL